MVIKFEFKFSKKYKNSFTKVCFEVKMALNIRK